MTTTIQATNEEEILKEALERFIEDAKTEEDFLNLSTFLKGYTRNVPLFTTSRGSYNMTFQINEMFKKHKIENWKTYLGAEAIATELVKDQLAIYYNSEYVIETVNEMAKNKLDKMVNDNCSSKDIAVEMFKITNATQGALANKIDAIYELAELYTTITIIRAFQHLQETRDFTVNMKKLRGVLLELKVDETGKQYIDYELMIKRGRPKNRHFVKVKSYKGKISTM